MSYNELNFASAVQAGSVYASDPAVRSFIDWKFPVAEQIIHLPPTEYEKYPGLRVLGALCASQLPLIIAMAGSELAPGQKILTSTAKIIAGTAGMLCEYATMQGINSRKPHTFPE